MMNSYNAYSYNKYDCLLDWIFVDEYVWFHHFIISDESSPNGSRVLEKLFATSIPLYGARSLASREEQPSGKETYPKPRKLRSFATEPTPKREGKIHRWTVTEPRRASL